MKGKKAFIVMCIGFCVIAVLASALLIAKVMGASIPDAMIRILGIIEMIAGPVVLVVGARMYNKEREKKNEKKKEK